jgi:transposase
MRITEYVFFDNEISLLSEYRDNQKDSRLQLRFIALLLLSKGSDVSFVSSIIGKNIKTIENWFQQYKTKGIDSLNSFQYKPKKTFLSKEQIEEVVSWVRKTNPAKTKEIRAYIKDHFKVTYSIEAVRVLLKKNGLKVLRPKVIPGNPPNEDEQKKTSKNTLT